MIFLVKMLQFLLHPFFWGPVGLGFWAISIAAWKISIIARLFGVRRIVKKNLQLVFPGRKDIDQLSGKLIGNLSQSLVEVLCAPFFQKAHWQERFIWRGLENVDAAYQKGRGIMYLNLHEGNYELMGMALFRKGYPMTAVVRTTNDPLLKLLDEIRLSAGGQLINVQEENMFRELLKPLAENKMALIMIDTGALESRNQTISLLGHRVPAATGWLTLAQRTGCAVLPAFSYREKDKIVATIGEPFFVTRENRDAAIKQTAEFYDKFLTAHPEEWAIFLNSYETRRMVNGN